jgi:hypothetical protein
MMLKTITDIQWGRAADPQGWAHLVHRAAAKRAFPDTNS